MNKFHDITEWVDDPESAELADWYLGNSDTNFFQYREVIYEVNRITRGSSTVYQIRKEQGEWKTYTSRGWLKKFIVKTYQ